MDVSHRLLQASFARSCGVSSGVYPSPVDQIYGIHLDAEDNVANVNTETILSRPAGESTHASAAQPALASEQGQLKATSSVRRYYIISRHRRISAAAQHCALAMMH